MVGDDARLPPVLDSLVCLVKISATEVPINTAYKGYLLEHVLKLQKRQ